MEVLGFVFNDSFWKSISSLHVELIIEHVEYFKSVHEKLKLKLPLFVHQNQLNWNVIQLCLSWFWCEDNWTKKKFSD